MSRGSSEELPPRPTAVSPKRRFVKLGRKTSDGSQQSGTSSEAVRKPSKGRIRNHSNRLSGVFLRGPSGSMASSIRSSLNMQTRKASTISTCALIAEDPSELSNHVTAPGVLKIFGNEICEGAHYKSVLATTHSSAKELVKEALERYGLNKDEAPSYVLCDTIGSIGDNRWRTEGFRVVGDNEKPLLLQSLWKPREGMARRFEIQRKSSVEEQALREKDTVTAGINAQARKLQKSRSRVATTLLSSSRGKLWRSKSSTDMLDCHKDKSPAHQSHTSLQSYEIPKTCPEQSHIESEEGKTNGLCEPEEWEREETESSDENITQYCIHPPHHCPYLLLLHGRSSAQDFIIYLLTCQSTTVGRASDSDPDSKVDIPLIADDILPKHCQLHRCENGGPTTLCPCPDAVVLRNGELLKTETQLNPGDIVGLGQHYLFMFKDPAPLTHQDSSEPDPVPWLLAHTSVNELFLCHSCFSLCTDRGPPFLKTPQGHDLTITFPPETADCIIKEIIELNRSPHRPPLTVAFLLSLCVQYSSTSLQASDLRRLLLIIASHVQSTMWELTKDLAAVQPEVLDREDLQTLSLEAVISGLRPLVVWMSNSLELLHFIQCELPVFLEWRSNREQGHVEGSDKNLVLQIYLSSVHSATEQTIAVLEEVVMLAFQQCVYYITKVLFPMLPAVLDCNPFRGSPDPADPTDGSSILGSPGLKTPPELQQVLEVLDQTWRLLQDGHLHQDISAQLIAYLFYFINASLFNSLMERGSEAGFYQWARGVHMRACLDLLLDWAHESGLGELVSEQTLTLSSAINLLATPRKTLVKTSWSSLRSLYPALCPSQLHHLLSLYSPGSHYSRIWSPCVPDRAAAHQTSDILESFDTHHPLVLPDGGYQFQSGREVPDRGLWEQMEKLREIISTVCDSSEEPKVPLKADSKPSPHSSTPPPSPNTSLYYDFSSCAAHLLSQRLQNLELQNREEDSSDLIKPALDPSCLLTPPNTPHIAHHQLTTTQQEQWKCNEINPWSSEGANKKGLVFECLTALKADRSNMKTLVELKEEEEEEEEEDNNNDEVFSLELERGERGIGLALIDTREDTLLKVKGLFIRAVVPDSPAARCERLAPGDRILAVNGVSLLGLDYLGGKELIQSSGDKVRLLVARSDWMSKALETEH